MAEFLQQLINGLALGAIYALIALGYTMVYGVLRFINFAHGDVFMLGSFTGYYVAPEIAISVDDRGLTVQDNGPGIPPEVVAGILDFAVRVSSREAYVSPCRGAQG